MLRLIIIFLNLAPILLLYVVCTGNDYSRKDFPPEFVFGSGVSAYQVEGAADKDGRSPSVWDNSYRFSDGYSGDIGADQYHKYKEDVKLMVDTGLDAYRFSISWSRLIPKGSGPVNPKGLQYYNNLINELISNGVQPHVTLCHFDHPQALEDEYGGWVSRKMVKDFKDYADVCFREFGDRIQFWTTLNQPNALVLGGYDWGFFPPWHCSTPFGLNCTKGNSSTEPYLVAHHILLAHASVVRLYRKKYQGMQFGHIGINLLLFHYVPLTNSTEDMLATQRANDFHIGLFMNPLVYGDYPEIVKKNAGLRLPVFTNSESRQVKGSFDFLGVNHYSRMYIKDNSYSLKSENRDFMSDMAAEMVEEVNASTKEFPIMPGDLQFVLEYVKQVYGNPPIYIHENGQKTPRNSELQDISRVKYIYSYIGSLLDAIRNGSNARGYFTWSFLDVFELLDGYNSSFGLYYVDLDGPELKRYPKLSAHWYAHFLKGGSVNYDRLIKLGKESLFWS